MEISWSQPGMIVTIKVIVVSKNCSIANKKARDQKTLNWLHIYLKWQNNLYSSAANRNDLLAAQNKLAY